MEEQKQDLIESQESKTSSTNEDETKEPIEILNVELLASGKECDQDHSVDGGNKMESNENNPKSGIESKEEKNPGKSDNENNLMVMEEHDNNDTQMDVVKGKEVSTTNVLDSSNPTTSGLGLLAQYDSDNEDKISDTDSVIEVPLTSAQDYRNQVVEIDSDSDSDDSSASSDVEYLNELRKTIEKRIEVVDEDDDDDEEGGKKKHTPKLKVKGELLLEDLPPIQDLQITVSEDECIEFGKIHSIVDQLVLVSALPNAILLDLETVIFLEKGQKVLGEVFDVLGQVADPLYCVRFNSNKQIKEKEINMGDVVYVAPKTQYTQYVILSNLMKVKGSDASWENDNEPPPRFLDYSDDEQEQLAKRQLRNKDRPVDNDDPSKRLRTGEDNEVSSSNRIYQSDIQQRNRYNDQRHNRGGGNFNNYNRPRFNGPQLHNQPRIPNPNHHRNSWHSNYYPHQNYPQQPPASYGIPSNNQPSPSQAFPTSHHATMYAMPPLHNMPYPSTQQAPHQPSQYAGPPMMAQHNPQLMPNTFSIRPPSLHGPPPPHMAHRQQYTAPPPPPPGSQ